MDPQKRQVLILHGSAGYGHQKAAEALGAAVRERYPGVRVDVRDALDFFPRWLKKAYAGVYLHLIHHHPRVWGFNYALFDCRAIAPVTDAMRRAFNGLMAPGLARLLVRERPDVIFCTHFLSAEIVADLKRQGRCPGRAVTVITDFLVHRFWVFRETDLYAVASEKTREALAGMGIDPRRVAVTGIPVDAKFARAGDRAAAARKLGLDPGRFTVLLTSGGAATGPLREALARIQRADPDAQVAVIAGKNEAFKRDAAAFAAEHPGVKVFGFVHNMDEFMDACDVIVGKGGGLTLSEALAKKKIFFILSPVPGQEANNAACLEGLGAAAWVRSLDELERAVAELVRDPARREKFARAIEGVSRPDSARRAAEAGLAGP
jgi:processive 1,2-diacylglycerol beta-glucosyltransferase